MLQDRFEQTGDRSDLDEAIRLYQLLLRDPALAREPEITRLLLANDCANTHLRRYQVAGERNDLDRAIRLWRRAIRASPEGNPDLPGLLNNLGNALLERGAETGAARDRRLGIASLEQAVDLVPAGSPDRPVVLDSLADALVDRYEQRGRAGDLERALELWNEAVEETAETDPRLAGHLNNYATGLHTRFEKTGNIDDLERVIHLHRKALDLTPPRSPDRILYLSNVGNSLRELYDLSGNPSDLEEAVVSCQRALDECTPESKLFAMCCNHLATLRVERYVRLGDPTDLEKGVSISRLGLGAAGPKDRPLAFHNLGIALFERYNRSGDLSDLDDAINLWEQARKGVSEGSPEISKYLNSLGSGLQERFRRRGDPRDLEGAVAIWIQAVQKCPSSSRDAPIYWNSLANGLVALYVHIEDREAALDDALLFYDLALNRTLLKSPDLPIFLNGAAQALHHRFEQFRRISDLDTAIEYLRRAVAGNGASSPDFSICADSLGHCLVTRFLVTGRMEDRDEAVALLSSGSAQALAISPEDALRSAARWGDLEMDRDGWPAASVAYGRALAAGDRLFALQLARADKESWLREIQELPSHAAYALARSGRPEEAVSVLEWGLARLMSEAFERDRLEFNLLRNQSPSLHRRYEETAHRLATLQEIWRERPERSTEKVRADLEGRIREARVALRECLEEIRRLPEFEGFLRPPTFADIQAILAAAHHLDAVVYLATTQAGSMAVLVAPEALDVVWSTLTKIDLQTLLTGPLGGAPDGYLAGIERTEVLRRILRPVLVGIGEPLMRPLADRLLERGFRRIALVPAGRLTALPLQAALYTRNGQTVSFHDEIIVSFIPNVRALGMAQRILPERGRAPVLLAVGDPQPHPVPLPGARAEVLAISSFFPPEARQVLCGTAAVKTDVLAQIAQATHLHLACHGTFDAATPLLSRLELAGVESMTLAEVLDGGARPERARLAVLSACQSAATNVDRLPDELIGWPAGFLQAGVPGVIGALWRVEDLAAMLIMVRFYKLLLQGETPDARPIPPADALQRAVLWLRQATNCELAALFEESREAVRRGETGPLPAAALLAGLVRFAGSEDPDDRPFADSPADWAAFVCVGI